MEILSDYAEEDSKTTTNPSYSSTTSKQFNGVLDPSNPLGFIETALEFVARESNLFKSDSVVKYVNSLVLVVKEKLETEERKAEKIIKDQSKTEATVAPIKEEIKKHSEVADSKDDEEKNKKDSRAPNNGNGLDMGNYSWGQSLQEVNINIPVPPGTKSSFIVCEIKKNHLKVGLKGQPPIIDGELFQSLEVDDCFWSLEDQKPITVCLTKQYQMEWWKYLVKGDPEIDTQKVEPESSKLSDLDPETRSTVEKMMHETVCNFKSYNCPYAGRECAVTGEIPFLVSHLRDDHKIDTHTGCTFNHRYVKSNPLQVENAIWMLTVFHCFGQYFCLHFEDFILGKAPVYMAFLRFMGDKADARNYRYSLEVGANGRKLIWEGTPRSVRDSHRKVRDSLDGLIIQRNMALFFSDGDRKELKLRVRGRIWKEEQNPPDAGVCIPNTVAEKSS